MPEQVGRSVAREVTAADLSVGDFIEAYDGYAEVAEVVPHGACIGDGTEEWISFRVYFHHPITDLEEYTTTVGPWRASRKVRCWSR